MASVNILNSLFKDGPEYERRRQNPFVPPNVTLSQLRRAVPQQLFEKSTLKGMFYVTRHVLLAFIAYELAQLIDPFSDVLFKNYGFVGTITEWFLWSSYWFLQSVILAGWWCLGHEAGHGNISSIGWVNDTVGFILHTFLLTPYFSWRFSHSMHHKSTASVERDENHVPRTRSDYGLPDVNVARAKDYHDILEETPLYTLGRLIVTQLAGMQLYLLTNISGSPRHGSGANHFLPSSPLFKPGQRNQVIISDFGLIVIGTTFYIWTGKVGIHTFVKLYFIPYLLSNHWVVMLTYLQHSDPTIPVYRRGQWSFVRGALSTIDRPLLGNMGRFLFHNATHDHISHHLFPNIPFYNQPKTTDCIKAVLKENYNYDSTNSFRALYRSFTECMFIEDEGDIVFYKNSQGKASRVLAKSDKD
ncbi:hypothetical protein K435DRAFT_751838 [Dendrothele bispora CBS 962.96]|uniref:Fatty acid desaturase domain-containing protein n=1 Tax=Dendrothele bispora (strain CBS 962.96) TaxID=1314807 RepID=A0A4S8MAE5_DENBC|nr:hypothetical protein K435DRAFT_751838 [Dendrothele bispora CBS 962.96]